MIAYAAIIGVVAGICLGFSILYLFIGLRRREERSMNLLFAAFAFAYAGTLLMGIGYRSTNSVVQFLAISRWDAIFVVSAFVALIWFVATYSQVRPRATLWTLTVAFLIAGAGIILTPSLQFEGTVELQYIPLPWGGQIANLDGSENLFGTLFLLAQLTTLGYIIYAAIQQYRRGERQPAILLLAGMAWFIVALFYEILGESGLVSYLPLAETGFLGVAIAVSLQMANRVIKTEGELDVYRRDLELMVAARTAELVQAQDELVRSVEETAATEERNRIARDVHDEVTQTVYAATLITESLPTTWERDPAEGQRNLRMLRQLVRGALAELRALLFELRPTAIEAADIEMLLRQQGEAMTGRVGVPAKVVVSGAVEMNPDVKVTFYRLTQEALNNVGKHALASEVNITLRAMDDQILLTIRDDGQGFDPGAVGSEGHGLSIMRERAASIGALLDIDSEPGAGTQLSVLWPAEVSVGGGISP